MARAMDFRLDRLAQGTVEVTLITPSPSADLTPLVPSVMSGTLSPWQAAIPFRPWLRHVKVVHAKLDRVDSSTRQLQLSGPSVEASLCESPLGYDALILAPEPLVASPSDNSNEVPCPIDCARAMDLRGRILALMTSASLNESSRHRRAKLAVAVIGNDAYAASIALSTSRLLREASRFVDRVAIDEVAVSLISTAPDLSGGLGPAASRFVQNSLENEGISLHLDIRQVTIEGSNLALCDRSNQSKNIEATTVIQAQRHAPQWPGVEPICDENRSGFAVKATGELVGSDAIFVLGPCAIDEGSAMKASNTPASVLVQAQRLAEQLVPSGRAFVKPRAVREGIKLDALHLSLDRGAVLFGNRAIGGLLGAVAAQRAILAVGPSSWWHLLSPLIALNARSARSNGPFPSLLEP